MAREPEIAAAFDASDVTFRVLRAFGWGPLLNYGYYPFPPPLTLLNFAATGVAPALFAPLHNLAAAQLRLLERAEGLLGVGPRDRVLDLACGRGLGAFRLASAHPGARVTAVDLLARNLQVARTLYDHLPNLALAGGDATVLPFRDAAFTRALCVEAAFQFADRQAFLAEIRRVLAVGGRAVVLDFAWADEGGVRRDDPDLVLLRRTWRFESLGSEGAYRRAAAACGLGVVEWHDWSANVLAPLHTISDWVAWLGVRPWGRWLLCRNNPVLQSLDERDWQAFARSVRAHLQVGARTRYVAMVLTRPPG